ncbi:MAG: adenosylmethionine--8-amino-7-oxononanoate transaminase [Planctomycetes bacterium]|nr:adenosylmethionine--8-amino-7-oxononanoate transaminase [Planctomycetota bacterium]
MKKTVKRRRENRSSRLIEADKAHVWHPFTPMRQWIADADAAGRLIVGADGFELIDSVGRRYIDGFSSLWCNLHGHRVRQIDSAIRRQLDRVAHTTLLGHASEPSIELAGRLVRIAPKGLTRVFYSDSGATAVEIALKMAFQYWLNRGQKRRRRFIALRQSYHGDTIGSVSLGGIEAFRSIFRPLLFEADFVDSPNPFHHPSGGGAGKAVLRQVEKILDRSADEFCAVIVEPMIQGAAGMLTHTGGFLADLWRLTRRHGVLLIADEVATGFCRTGRLFACEHENVSPDLMCIGKGLTGGYLPVAATLATDEIFDAFLGEPHEGKTFYHGHTFTGNALGCAAAVASVDLIFSSRLIEKLPPKIAMIRRCLDRLAGHRHVADVRQCGMMAGVELMADPAGRRAFDLKLRVGAAVCRHARRHGLIIRPLGDVVALMPAPAMDTATLGRMLDAVEATIDECFQKNIF